MKNSDQFYQVRASYSVKRAAQRAKYAKVDVNGIIDSAYLCHLSFIEGGKPTSVPMACWRCEDYLYLHAATRGRLSKVLIGKDVCISIALFDGLVLGNSAFNHSYNYRSVVIHSQVELVADATDKLASMRAFVDHVVPGRWDELRPVREHELRATTVLRAKLTEVAGKVRNDFSDDEADTPDWPTWVGVIPAALTFATPAPDPRRNQVITPPDHVANYRGVDSYQSIYLLSR